MTNPIVNDFVVQLNDNLFMDEILSADGPVSKYRIRDTFDGSGNLYINGIRRDPGTWITFNAADVATVEYRAASEISRETIQFQAYNPATNSWGDVVSVFAYNARPNTTQPTLVANTINLPGNERVNVADYITAMDPDGFPLVRYLFRDNSINVRSGYFVLDGVAQTQGQSFFVEAADLAAGKLEYFAGVGDQSETITARVADGQGMVAETWSDPINFVAITRANNGRPIVETFDLEFPEGLTVQARGLFRTSDPDGNRIKQYMFFDTSIAPGSSFLSIGGVVQPEKTWITVDASQLNDVFVTTATVPRTDQFRIRAFDGRNYSKIETFTVKSKVQPDVEPGGGGGSGLTSGMGGVIVLEDREEASFADLFEQIGDGNPITRWEIFDANTDNRSARIGLNGILAAQGTIVSFNNFDIENVFVRGGAWENSWVDEFYIRGTDGQLMSDWTRVIVRTEPEVLEGNLGSGLNVRNWNLWSDLIPVENGKMVLTYSFAEVRTPDGRDTGEVTDDTYVGTPTDVRQSVRQVFGYLEEMLSDVTFEEVSDSSVDPWGFFGGIFRIGSYFDPDSGAAAFVTDFPNDPSTDPEGGDVWLNRAFLSTAGFSDFGFSQMVFAHELGHAMGLKHNFGAEFPVVPTVNYNHTLSVMNTPGDRMDGLYVKSHGLYDVNALQTRYGQNFTTRSGDTLYDIPGYWNGNQSFVETIWDGGGIDTFDFSASSFNDVVSLIEGSTSWVGLAGVRLNPGAVHNANLNIAYGTLIENVTTGAGANDVTGNLLDNQIMTGEGDDTIRAMGGDDYVSGGRGNDRYLYGVADGNDTYNEDQSNGRDVIEIDPNFIGLTNFTNQVSFTKLGRDLMINLRIAGGQSEGSIRIVNMKWGGSRIETLNVLGTDVDLTSVFAQTGSPNARFIILSDMGTYGHLVAPV